jgi:hypothetical protein
MKLASVIPLDYGEHVEEAVTIIDTDWNNLQSVLRAPNEYLADCTTNEFQLDPLHRPWKLRTPAVAELSDVTASCPFTLAFIDFAQQVLGDKVPVLFSDYNLVDEHKKWEASLALLSVLSAMEPFNTGYFILRFAVDTGILHIGYKAPKTNGVYKGRLTDATKSMCKSPYTSRTAILHVDLVRSSRVSDKRHLQAQYAVDAICNFEEHLKRVAARPANRFAPTAERGQTVAGQPRTRLPRERPLDRSKEPLNKRYLISPLNESPRVTLEYIDDAPIPDGYTPCVYYPECHCCAVPGTSLQKYHVGEMVCKLYYVGTSG